MGLTEKLYGKIHKRFPTPPRNEVSELDSDGLSASSSIISTESGGRYRMTPIATGKGGKGKRNKLSKRTKTPKQLDQEIIEEAEDEAEAELEQEYDNLSFASRTGSEPVQIRESPAQYQATPDIGYDEPIPEQFYRHQAPIMADYESSVSSTAPVPVPAYPDPRDRHALESQHRQRKHKHRSKKPVIEPHISRRHKGLAAASAPRSSAVRSACSCGSEKIIHASNCGCHACVRLHKGKRRFHKRKHELSRKLERLHKAEEGARCHCADCKKKRYKAKLKKEIIQEIEERKRHEQRDRHRHRYSRHQRHHDRYDGVDSRTEVEYIPVPVHRHGHRGHRMRDGPVTRADLESLAYEVRRQQLSPYRRTHRRYY